MNLSKITTEPSLDLADLVVISSCGLCILISLAENIAGVYLRTLRILAMA